MKTLNIYILINVIKKFIISKNFYHFIELTLPL